MKNSLIDYMNELNSTMKRIEEKENLYFDKSLFLPILTYLTVNNLISNIELNKFLKDNSHEIKKLKFFAFNDFLNVSDNLEDYLSKLTDEIADILPENIDNQGLNFLLYEILINIYKHSKFKNAYVQLDIENNGENVDIFIIDDGIGIPGSFREASFDYEHDHEAIYNAINGKTTDKEKYSLHGRGLNSSARIATSGFDGEMLIASGKGICLISKSGAKALSNENNMIGTFIILKIYNRKIENIYEYLKYEKINKIIEVEND